VSRNANLIPFNEWFQRLLIFRFTIKITQVWLMDTVKRGVFTPDFPKFFEPQDTEPNSKISRHTNQFFFRQFGKENFHSFFKNLLPDIKKNT
jgi:hypothetical protein